MWGWNGRGGLATGSSASVESPKLIRLPSQMTQLAFGTDFTLGLSADGGVWSWGGNDYGQLGDGSARTRLTLTRLDVPEGIVAVDAADAHAAAVTADGRLYIWGRNHRGQLGDGTRTDRSLPTQIAVPGHVTGVSLGRHHTVAVTGDGSVYAWGLNAMGQLGLGSAVDQHQPAKVALPGGARVRVVQAGENASAALTAEGEVFVWGNSVVAGFGRHGGGQRPVDRPAPADGLEGSTDIAMGGHHVAVRTRGDDLLLWGRNHHGQLGDGTTVDRPLPKPVGLGEGHSVVALAAAGDHTLVITSGGEVWRIGTSKVGAAGTRTQASTSAEAVPGIDDCVVRSIAAGPYALGVLVEPAATPDVSPEDAKGQTR
jgi:alpha-tubulin suppressor-like RCC1 family protein